MVEGLLGKSILGNLRPCVLGFEAEIPESFQVRSISWETTRHSNNCNLHGRFLMSILGAAFFVGSQDSMPVA